MIDSLREYTESLTDIDNKLLKCREDASEIRDELLRSKQIFEQQSEDLTRKIAWITIHVFSHVSVEVRRPFSREVHLRSNRRNAVMWSSCIAVSIEHCNSHPKQETCSVSSQKSIWMIFIWTRSPPSTSTTRWKVTRLLSIVLEPILSSPDSAITREIATDFVQFIANHMQDTRIVNIGERAFLIGWVLGRSFLCLDVRDNVIQSLSAYCFYSGSLRALENMREHNRTVLIRALLTPYPNRSWAMTNLILVRFWKGYGFGFRYSHVYPSKFLQSLRKDRVQGKDYWREWHWERHRRFTSDPSPSVKYQQEIGRYLSKNVDEAIVFLNSLLGQLNWAFSEFMGLLKDVKQRTHIRSLTPFFLSFSLCLVGSWQSASGADRRASTDENLFDLFRCYCQSTANDWDDRLHHAESHAGQIFAQIGDAVSSSSTSRMTLHWLHWTRGSLL